MNYGSRRWKLLAHDKQEQFLREFARVEFCMIFPFVRRSCSFLVVNILSSSLPIHRQISMVFACQQDSFLRNFRTKVVSCKAGKLAGKDAYELVLEDTVLFPEGGGQVGLIFFLIT